MKKIAQMVLLGMLLLCITLHTRAMSVPEQPNNPVSYFSQNHVFRLHVVSSVRHGSGSAEVTFYQHETLLWKKTFADGLSFAAISNNGEIAGYYSSFNAVQKKFITLLITDKQGNIRYQRNFPITGSVMHGPDLPSVGFIVMHNFNQHVGFKMWMPDEKTVWQTVSLQTWHELPYENGDLSGFEKLQPSEHSMHTLAFEPKIECKAEPARNDTYRCSDSHSRYCLLDKQWKEVWCERFENDLLPEQETTGHPVRAMRQSGEYMGFTDAKHFWITKFQKRTRDTYAIGNSTAEFVAAVPFQPQSQEPYSTPARIAALALDKEIPIPRIRPFAADRVMGFAIGNNNEKAVLVRGESSYFFKRYDQNGKLQISKPLSLDFGNYFSTQLVAYQNQQWLLLTKTGYKDDAKLFVISASGEISREIAVDAPAAERIAASSSGNISLIGGNYLRQVDAQGKTLWTQQERSTPASLLSPTDIAITSSQELVVLENITNKVKFYDESGHYLRELDIKKIAGLTDPYLASLAFDKRGAMYLFDFSSRHLLIINGDQLTGNIRLHDPENVSLVNTRNISFDSNSTLWVAAEKYVAQYNGDGMEVASIARRNESLSIQGIDWISVDPNENIYVFDRTQSLLGKHNRHGQFDNFFRLPVEWRQQEQSLSRREIKIERIGDRFIVYGTGNQHVEINSRGEMISKTLLPCDAILSTYFPNEKNAACSSLSSQSGSHYFWHFAYSKILLLANPVENRVIAQVERASDGNWLEGLSHYGQSENGWLAVSSYSDKKIHVIDSAGVARAAISMGDVTVSNIQLANDCIYVKTFEEGIRVYSLDGKLLAVAKTIGDKRENFIRGAMYASESLQKLYVAGVSAIKVYNLPGRDQCQR